MIKGIINILRLTAMNFLDNNYSAVLCFSMPSTYRELALIRELKIKKNRIKIIKSSNESYKNNRRISN